MLLKSTKTLAEKQQLKSTYSEIDEFFLANKAKCRSNKMRKKAGEIETCQDKNGIKVIRGLIKRIKQVQLNHNRRKALSSNTIR